MTSFDVLREIRELKNQLSYSKNTGFFFGAGTSCAIGMPDISKLTSAVSEALGETSKVVFERIRTDLASQIKDRVPTIEDVLNQLRRIREITGESATKTYLDVCGKDAVEIDREICGLIYKVISEKETCASLDATKRFFAWYNLLNRDQPKEVFTTNYDLVVEKALEGSEIPYFDGFVGSYEPFFWQESVDHSSRVGDLTQNWIRLWKLHGSLNWFWRSSEESGAQRIVRLGNVGPPKGNNQELVVYPSRDKYDSSRKQPFIAYFDRLRSYLLSGELLFVISGYSFSDQHVNEVILNSMRRNNRLFVVVFLYRDTEVQALHKLASTYLNLHAFGPTKGIIGGVLGDWNFAAERVKTTENASSFWSVGDSRLTLGDFCALSAFLTATSGKGVPNEE